MVKLAFEYLGLTRIQLRCFADNQGSVRVAQKLNFTQEGFIKQGAILNVMTDYYIFGLLKENYDTNPIYDSIVSLLPQ